MWIKDFYKIEEGRDPYYGTPKYRFVSYYNGTRGMWCYKKEEADKEGQKHGELVKYIHGKAS